MSDQPGLQVAIPAQDNTNVRTPLWRRITAAFALSSMVVLGGLFLASMFTLAILMVLYLLEQAIA